MQLYLVRLNTFPRSSFINLPLQNVKFPYLQLYSAFHYFPSTRVDKLIILILENDRHFVDDCRQKKGKYTQNTFLEITV